MARESTLKNLVLTLMVITALSALGLGGMNVLTTAPIAASKQAKILAALQDVLPTFDNNPALDTTSVESDGVRVKVYQAKEGDKWVGSAVESFTMKGFGGFISVMVGFDNAGKITGYSVLQHAETPGLGDHMLDWFKPAKDPEPSAVEKLFRFKVPVAARSSDVYGKVPGANGLTVSKDGGEIDAITAATISSRAFLDAVNRAYHVFTEANAGQIETKGE